MVNLRRLQIVAAAPAVAQPPALMAPQVEMGIQPIVIAVAVAGSVIGLLLLRIAVHHCCMRTRRPVGDGPGGLLLWLLCCVSTRERRAEPSGSIEPRSCNPSSWQPLSTNLIAALPAFTADPAKGKPEQEEECPICQEAHEPESLAAPLAALPCGHVFHRHCLQEWLARKACCPLCQLELTQQLMEEHCMGAPQPGDLVGAAAGPPQLKTCASSSSSESERNSLSSAGSDSLDGTPE